MIEALFGSKTRIKLLHLFLNNPGESFFVREITRKIDEQINSVRRELSNMLTVGIITCDGQNNKLFYKVNQRYEYYLPLKMIFSDKKDDVVVTTTENAETDSYSNMVKLIPGLKLVIFSGVLVKGSASSLDILFTGNIQSNKLKSLIDHIEKNEGRELNYSIMPQDEFYYRLSVRDKFITDIVNNKHIVVLDKDEVLK